MGSASSQTSAPAATKSSRVDGVPELPALDRHGYLFGLKLANSWSPFLHDAIYQELGLQWGQVRLESADVELFLKLVQHPNFYGASVTMPNKVAIIPHLDELTPECRDVGACNTLFLRTDPSTGRRLLCGANTDVIGIRDSFTRNVPASLYEGRPGLVIGGGGAARSAVYALRRKMGIGRIYLVNRDAAEVDAVVSDCVNGGYGDDLVHVRAAEEAKGLEGPGAIVSCIPDYPPKTDEEVAAREVITAFLQKEAKGAMLEMCYNPSPWTELGALAGENGWEVILGTEAMIWQGLEQDRYWTGKTIEELPVQKVKEVIAGRVAEGAKARAKI